MPLSADEAAILAKRAIELGIALIQAFSTTSDGGRKLTKDERRALAGQAKALALDLLRDVVD